MWCVVWYRRLGRESTLVSNVPHWMSKSLVFVTICHIYWHWAHQRGLLRISGPEVSNAWGTHGWGITWKFFSPHKMTLLRETTQLILQGSAFACKLHFDRIYWIGERWTLLTVMVTPWRNDCPYHPTVRIKCVETDTGLSAKKNLPVFLTRWMTVYLSYPMPGPGGLVHGEREI